MDGEWPISASGAIEVGLRSFCEAAAYQTINTTGKRSGTLPASSSSGFRSFFFMLVVRALLYVLHPYFDPNGHSPGKLFTPAHLIVATDGMT